MLRSLFSWPQINRHLHSCQPIYCANLMYFLCSLLICLILTLCMLHSVGWASRYTHIALFGKQRHGESIAPWILCRSTIIPVLSHDAKALMGPSATCALPSHMRRRSSLAPHELQNVLADAASTDSSPQTSPALACEANRDSSMVTPPLGFEHGRQLSSSSKKINRLSLSFPVTPNLGSGSSASVRHTPTSSISGSFPPTPLDSASLSASDPGTLLVAVAGQERRVLELKEELAKAELDLKTLKKQWHLHEATRKRAEIRNSAQLQPLQSVSIEPRASIDSTCTRQSMEVDRKKALMANTTKAPRRKVFRGGHARTLSLLSPQKQEHEAPLPVTPLTAEMTTTDASPPMPDTSHGITKVTSSRASARHSYQHGVTYGAKQLADGMRSGLWTFLEDLRQATVGDEAVSEPKKRPSTDSMRRMVRKASRGSLRSRKTTSSRPSIIPRKSRESLSGAAVNDSANASLTIWPGAPRTASGTVKMKPMALAPPVDDDDGWSNWDSPAPRSPIRWSGSSISTNDPVTPSHRGAENTVR